MMNFSIDYTPERHRAVESIMTEMSGDPELARNYNGIITIMGPKLPAFVGPKVFKDKIKAGRYNVITLSENDKFIFVFCTFASTFGCLLKILFMPCI